MTVNSTRTVATCSFETTGQRTSYGPHHLHIHIDHGNASSLGHLATQLCVRHLFLEHKWLPLNEQQTTASFFFLKKIHKTHTTPHHWKDKSICTVSVVCLTAQTKTYAKLLFQWAVQEYLRSTNSAKLKSKQFRQVTYHHITPRRTQEAMLQKPHQNGIKSVFLFIFIQF